MTTYLTITPDGTITSNTGDLDMEYLQAIVGGEFEQMPKPTDLDIIVFASQDAKAKGENVNHAAKRLLGSRLRPNDYIAGIIVIVGPASEAGDATDITEDVEQEIRERLAP